MTQPHPAGDGVHGGISLEQIGRFQSGQFDEDAAEIIAYSPTAERLYVVNAELGGIEVLDLADPSNPDRTDRLDPGAVWDDAGEVTNVTLREGDSGDGETTAVLAAAVMAETPQDPGRIVFFDAIEGAAIAGVEVGAGPDKVAFTPDGTRVLSADSGEPSDDYERDPPGTVSIVDVRDGFEDPNVAQADFTAYDGREAELRERGVHLHGPAEAASDAIEPEYLTVTADSKTAYVVLQINNAIAVVDIESAAVEDIHPLGYKDHAATGNELDASDVDRLCIRNWPVEGMYQPDAIECYEVDGQTYLVTANEGANRDTDGFDEVTKVRDLTLDPAAFDLSDVSGVDSVADLQEPHNLGNLDTTTAFGDVDDDGRHESLYAFGGRSFAIWRPDGTLVYDSGADFELLVAMHHPEHFNADGTENEPFARSTAKGPEPEGIAVGRVDGRDYAFVGLERIGSLVVYDVTDPEGPAFVQYINNRNFDVDPEADVEDGPADLEDVGDLGPEGVTFIPGQKSPVEDPLVAVANELSGTTTLYRVHRTQA